MAEKRPVFGVGDRVQRKGYGPRTLGTVDTIVRAPGEGGSLWPYVKFDDGSESSINPEALQYAACPHGMVETLGRIECGDCQVQRSRLSDSLHGPDCERVKPGCPRPSESEPAPRTLAEKAAQSLSEYEACAGRQATLREAAHIARINGAVNTAEVLDAMAVAEEKPMSEWASKLLERAEKAEARRPSEATPRCRWSNRIGYDCELSEGHEGGHQATDLDGTSKVGWGNNHRAAYQRPRTNEAWDDEGGRPKNPDPVAQWTDNPLPELRPSSGYKRPPPEGLDCPHERADVHPYRLDRMGVLEWCDRCGAKRCLGAEWTYPTEWYRPRPEPAWSAESGDPSEGSRLWRCEKELRHSRELLAKAERTIHEFLPQLGCPISRLTYTKDVLTALRDDTSPPPEPPRGPCAFAGCDSTAEHCYRHSAGFAREYEERGVQSAVEELERIQSEHNGLGHDPMFWIGYEFAVRELKKMVESGT